MSPLRKIIFLTLPSGIFAAALYILCSWYLFMRAVSDAFWMPISFSGIHFVDEAIDILAVSVLLASQLICPLCAFTLRRSVLSVTNSAKIRILVFSLIAGFQIILVSMVYAVADANARIQVHKITQEESKKTRSAAKFWLC